MLEQLVQQKDNLAHAYILEGGIEEKHSDLLTFLNNELEIETAGNPNIFIKKYDRLGIDGSRALGELQLKTAVGADNYKIFIVSFNSITIEAQNALLKILEDPSSGTIWFFLTTNHRILLPTVLSRLSLIQNDSDTAVYKNLVQDFTGASFVEREKICKLFLGDSKKDISPKRADAAIFIGELMSFLIQNKPDEWVEMYREFEQMQDFATDRSSSLKHIFDYISIRLPTC